MSRMIPLKIADIAVAACEEEIQKLKKENARLKADLQMEKENEDRLVRNWQQANNEVHGLKAQVAALIDDQTRLKAEVERLEAFCTRTIIPNKLLQDEVERLGEENKKRQKDMELLFASYNQALEDIRRLHWDLQTAKEGKQS